MGTFCHAGDGSLAAERGATFRWVQTTLPQTAVLPGGPAFLDRWKTAFGTTFAFCGRRCHVFHSAVPDPWVCRYTTHLVVDIPFLLVAGCRSGCVLRLVAHCITRPLTLPLLRLVYAGCSLLGVPNTIDVGMEH